MTPLFIVSVGRSGSKMLARVLAEHPGFHAVHEPGPALSYDHYKLWSGAIGTTEAHQILERFRDPVIQQCKEKGAVYAESAYYMSFFIPFLQERYQRRFIHLIRDGRAFTTSGMARLRWYYLPRWLRRAEMQFERIAGFHTRRYSRWEYHRLLPPKSAKTRFEKMAWLWTEYNMTIDRMLRECGGQSLRIRLEDFRDDPRGSIERTLEYAGVEGGEHLEAMVTKCRERPNLSTGNRARRFRPPESWDAETKAAYLKWAGQASEYFGYE